jgi:hypothetical protein
MNGCILITRHFLEHCHNTHHGFTKWVVQPATGRFYLVPDAELTHTIRVIASTLEDILPTAHILAANRDNPHSTTVVNHTERPFLRIALAHTVTQYSVQHDHMWQLTHAMIHAFMTHDNWATNHPPPPLPNTNAPTTDTAAAPSDAPADPAPVPSLNIDVPMAGPGPVTTKAPPPSHPDAFSG